MSGLLPQVAKNIPQQLIPMATMKNQASLQVATSLVSTQTDTVTGLEKL